VKEYNLNITAMQIIKIEAESLDEAVENAFYKSFDGSVSSFANYEYEVVGVKEVK